MDTDWPQSLGYWCLDPDKGWSSPHQMKSYVHPVEEYWVFDLGATPCHSRGFSWLSVQEWCLGDYMEQWQWIWQCKASALYPALSLWLVPKSNLERELGGVWAQDIIPHILPPFTSSSSQMDRANKIISSCRGKLTFSYLLMKNLNDWILKSTGQPTASSA